MYQHSSCSTTYCHGGAKEENSQGRLWAQYDPHIHAGASLRSSWGERIAEDLNITNPAEEASCLSCHAPLALLSTPPSIGVAEGVGCVSCHGVPDQWYFSHMRSDYSREERVSLGMTDMREPNILADTCIRCHQSNDAALFTAGHPLLTPFDLSEAIELLPMHWTSPLKENPTKLWLVGLMTSLREYAWLKSQNALSPFGFHAQTAILFVLKQLQISPQEDFYTLQMTTAQEEWDAEKVLQVQKSLLSLKSADWSVLTEYEQYLAAKALLQGLQTTTSSSQVMEELEEAIDLSSPFSLADFLQGLKALKAP